MPKGTTASMGIGICASHVPPLPVTVTWPAGTPTVMSEGMMNLNMGSVGICSCGCSASALLVSATVLDEKMGVHRVGDTGLTGSGVYTVSTGAMTVLAGP